MASNNFRTFTITQARIGEPLQFQPALGSKELEELVDTYVIGSATKQDKLSEVTLEFFNHAQVDIYTGLLTRHYNVAVSPWTHFESPTQSQSSGFSPPIFTPSPASSMTFADSGYGSISLTPPTRNMGAPSRVTKKAKKDTKKTAEVILPGFSIMTKDGIDVTSSAGRGTKTKEQREHAHLMRIMKACDDCKRKKVRCDPSHRRSETDMSRSSTTTSSCSRPNPSPAVSVPSLSREKTHASPPELPSFGNNAVDDFVLFPEDNGSSWNPADMSLPEFDGNLDLSQFNFDISGLNDFSSTNASFDFFDQPSTSFQPDRSLDYERSAQNPIIADQYGLDQWASATGGDSIFHTRPHPSSSQNSGQLDSSFFDGGFDSTESPTSQNTPSSQCVSSFAEDFWANVSVPQGIQSSSVSLPSAEVDWSLLERGVIPSPDGELPLSSMNRRERRNLARVDRTRNASIQQLLESVPSANAGQSQSFAESFNVQHSDTSLSGSPLESLPDQSSSPGASSGGSLEYWGLENTHALVAEAAQALKSAPAAYQPIYEELQRLRSILDVVRSGGTERSPVLQQATIPQLKMLTSRLQVMLTRIKNILRTDLVSNERHNRLDPEFPPVFLRDASIQTRRLVSALCATINSIQTQDIGFGAVAATKSLILSCNRQGEFSHASSTQSHPQDAGEYLPDGSYSSMSSSFSSVGTVIIFGGIEQHYEEDYHQGGDMMSAISAANGLGSFGITTIDKQKYHIVTKKVFERLARLVETDSGRNAQGTDVFSATEYATALVHQDVVSSATPDGDALNGMTNVRTTPRQVQLQEQEFVRLYQTPAASLLVVNPYLEAAPHILTDRTQVLQSPSVSTVSVQNVGSSGSEPLEYQSGASSSGAIPGTVLDNTSWYNSSLTQFANVLDTTAIYAVMFASLVLLNYLQATLFILPLAAVLLAVPHPTPATIAKLTFAVVLAQSLPLTTLLSGLKYLVSAGPLSAPLFKHLSNGSFGGVLSVRPPSVSKGT